MRYSDGVFDVAEMIAFVAVVLVIQVAAAVLSMILGDWQAAGWLWALAGVTAAIMWKAVRK